MATFTYSQIKNVVKYFNYEVTHNAIVTVQ